jgi:hypothetical protein
MYIFNRTTKVFLWLAVSGYGVSEPVFFKFDLAVNKELYKYLPKSPKKRKKIVFWPNLARLEELKIEYVYKKKEIL